MSPSPIITDVNGYLVEDYLLDEYSDGELLYAYGQQASMTIAGQEAPYGQQAEMLISADLEIGMQSEMVIHDDAPVGMQISAETDAQEPVGMQVNAVIVGNLEATGMSAKADTLRHAIREYYLEDGYLEDPYLVTGMLAFPGFQANMRVLETKEIGQQAQMVIKAQRLYGQQARMVIHATRAYGMQVMPIQVYRQGQQATMVIYNDTQLRLMYLFTSRGTAALLGNNWTASNQAAGDFLPRNLNTDVEEQVFRSAASSVELICDTGVPQGVTIDTLALRNHNMTREASITVQGSNSPVFATINESFTIPMELIHSYYIAPTFPSLSTQQNRYWKFIIDDPTNPDGYVQIGLILFGNSEIFSLAENYENPLTRGLKHFKDSLQTDGFTAVMNDRALRKWIKLRFADLERINGNFRMLEAYVEAARTSLKSLVIPTPKYPSRFAVFAKLVQMPEMEHRNVSNMDDPDGRAEYITLQIDLDESL